MPIQAFQTNIVKKACVIINAVNFKQNMVLWDSVFLFRHKGLIEQASEPLFGRHQKDIVEHTVYSRI